MGGGEHLSPLHVLPEPLVLCSLRNLPLPPWLESQKSHHRAYVVFGLPPGSDYTQVQVFYLEGMSLYLKVRGSSDWFFSLGLSMSELQVHGFTRTFFKSL